MAVYGKKSINVKTHFWVVFDQITSERRVDNILPFFFFRLAQSVKVMIAVAIFLTYSLQFYVPFEIIWKGNKHRFTSHPVIFEYLLRVFLVVCTGKSIFAQTKDVPGSDKTEKSILRNRRGTVVGFAILTDRNKEQRTSGTDGED